MCYHISVKQSQGHLTTYDAAIALLTGQATALPRQSEGCALAEIAGRVLAEPLFAATDYPACDNSAMDGYCLRHADAAGATPANPVSLPIHGGSFAGRPCPALEPGTCAYIATGGMLPENADTIVKIEDVTVNAGETEARFSSIPPAGTYIRRRGKDMKAGSEVLNAGTDLTPAAVGIVASLGHMTVRVARRPRIALMTSGDEVLMPFEIPHPWEIRNSNTSAVSAQIRATGAIPLDFGICRDTGAMAVNALRRAADTADLIVTCGGVSLGKKDPFIAAFTELGVTPLIHGVAMKPGKPFFFGLFQGKPLFGLPGNQASCMVTFELFVRPFIGRVLGRTFPERLTMTLPLGQTVKNGTGRDHFLRGRLVFQNGAATAVPLNHQDSHLQSSLLGAQLLIRHPAATPELPAGTLVTALFLDQF
jgi:molybdopterin molybdotransferase